MDVIELTQKLISCPSITPKDEGALVYLAEQLETLGFTCHHLDFGEGDDHVPNLFARLGTESPHICYAGHTDVVPTGPENEWTYGPFNPHIEDGILYGRGASDMKGSVAAFTAAVSQFLSENKPTGSISLLITGDEEGPAINGTIKVLEWMKENNHIPDVALVGEPTNPEHLGQEIKIGRRGSVNGTITVNGKQGHVAYQHLADNPLPRLSKMVTALSDHRFDEGSDFFNPTNLEFTTIDVNNATSNVIPDKGIAKFNVRFNDHWNGQTLSDEIRKILDNVSSKYHIDFSYNSESFITQPSEWTHLVQNAVEEITGKKPAYTTTGGTSDARFIVNYCPVVECGGVNESIHQINENTDVDVLKNISLIYQRVLKNYFAAG